MPPAGTLSLTAAMWMIDGVHCDTADIGSPPSPAAPAGLAERDLFLVGVADLSDSGGADNGYHSHFTRGEFHLGVFALFRHELRRRAGTPNEAPSPAGTKLHVMDHRPQGDVLQRQGVPGLNVGIGAGDDHVAHGELVGSDNVTFLPILVADEGDSGRPVRVVFD